VENAISPVSRNVGYSEVKQKVFQVSCQSCHATQNPPLDDYADAAKAAAAIRKAVFDEKSMPKQGALSVEQQEILLAWLDQGTPEGEPAPEPSAQPSPSAPIKATWVEVKAKVLDVACNSCHAPGNTKGLSDLTVLANAQSDIGSIVGMSVENAMPPPDQSRPLSVEQKRLLTEWWIAGMPAN
jgi:cytochrome c5